MVLLRYFDLGRIYHFDFGRVISFGLRSFSTFSMSTNDLRSVRDSSNDYPFCQNDSSNQPPRQKRAVNGGDAHGYAPSPSEVQPSGSLVVALVIVRSTSIDFVCL